MYKDFWDLYVRQYRGLPMWLAVFFVTMTVSLMEGLNLGLLIPLIEMLKSPDQPGGHWVTKIIANAYEALGLPFELWSIVLAMGLLVLATASLKYFRLLLVGKTVLEFSLWTRTWLMNRILRADMAYFHSQAQGRLADDLTTQAGRSGRCLSVIAEIAASLGLVLAYLAASMVIVPALTGITID